MRRLLSNDVAGLAAALMSIVVVGWLAAMIAIFPDRILDAPRAEVRGGNQSCDFYGYPSDARGYAYSYGVDLEEAERRLCLQDRRTGSGIGDGLKRLAPDRFVVAELVHEPEFGLLVTFTGDSVPAGAQAVVDRAPLPVIVRAGAPFGEQDIKRIERGIGAALRDDPRSFHCDYNRVNERFEIQLLEVSQAQISYLRFSLPPLPDDASGHVHLRAADLQVAYWGGRSTC